jgi:hypothetical protein
MALPRVLNPLIPENSALDNAIFLSSYIDQSFPLFCDLIYPPEPSSKPITAIPCHAGP